MYFYCAVVSDNTSEKKYYCCKKYFAIMCEMRT